MQREDIEKQLKDLKQGVKGVDLSGVDPDELDSQRIRMIRLQALEKEKNEIGEKIRVAAKRIDHLERAYRASDDFMRGFTGADKIATMY